MIIGFRLTEAGGTGLRLTPEPRTSDEPSLWQAHALEFGWRQTHPSDAHSHAQSSFVPCSDPAGPRSIAASVGRGKSSAVRRVACSAPGMGAIDRNVFQLPAVRMNRICVISRVHQIVELPHALRCHCHQRDRNLRVVYARARQPCADRYLSVGDIEMEFVAAPILHVAILTALGADSDGHPRQADLRARNAPVNPRDIRAIRIGRNAWRGNGTHIMKASLLGRAQS